MRVVYNGLEKLSANVPAEINLSSPLESDNKLLIIIGNIDVYSFANYTAHIHGRICNTASLYEKDNSNLLFTIHWDLGYGSDKIKLTPNKECELKYILEIALA